MPIIGIELELPDKEEGTDGVYPKDEERKFQCPENCALFLDLDNYEMIENFILANSQDGANRSAWDFSNIHARVSDKMKLKDGRIGIIRHWGVDPDTQVTPIIGIEVDKPDEKAASDGSDFATPSNRK